MQYYVIGGEDVVLGFHMAGVAGSAVHGEEEVKESFREALSRSDVSVILIEEAMADLIRDDVDDYIFSHEFPLICEIPGTQGRDLSRPSLRDLAVRAMGVKI
ncbi:V-type ATP synthase subunit F [Entomospira entomophila]|uniref:Vacuolar H+transporting two-sector ATPase F subunit n=1 Tax=Entomospira entomophila TaxID=2719988 RepID=A0A968GB77_9SPIO|nr:V-type ATP synthase subunit F [Entomospira entomophilus]NIZ40433.1 Vacuolar H+transporting two-sector ATPase F subunit [Entomospira entomophilus]WDI35991.1 V-type ATP synthase subunit F [Entomospira entomophilus]